MAGDGNEMDVIAHQAPSQDAQSVPLGMFAQDFEIALAVFVGEEYCRLLPRCVMWCDASRTTKRGLGAMVSGG
jgi:hypothetical protein